jgi:UDP-N-acetyl-D-mannosaminuronate dehydrogenase
MFSRLSRVPLTVLSIGFVLFSTACSQTALNSVATNTASATTTLNANLAKAQAQLATVATIYGIAKGIATVAEQAQPSLTPIVNQAIAIGDPLMAKAQLVLADTATDVDTVNQMVTQLQAQANALQANTAQVVTVVPNKS